MSKFNKNYLGHTKANIDVTIGCHKTFLVRWVCVTSELMNNFYMCSREIYGIPFKERKNDGWILKRSGWYALDGTEWAESYTNVLMIPMMFFIKVLTGAIIFYNVRCMPVQSPAQQPSYLIFSDDQLIMKVASWS